MNSDREDDLLLVNEDGQPSAQKLFKEAQG